VLQQLNGRYASRGIALKALDQKVNTRLAELLRRRELRRIPLGDVVHDGPLVVHRRPGTAPRCHFQDHAAERPDVDGAVAARGAAADDFGGHVHRGAGHGVLAAALASVDGGEGAALARDELGGAEVNVFDYAVVVEEDVWGGS
jgi:hypothetical protein